MRERELLAASTRRLMDLVVRSAAGAPDLVRAREAVDEAVAVLSESVGAVAPRDTIRFVDGVAPFNPVVGTANPYAPPLRCRPDEDGGVVGEVELGAIHEGPPRAVHGGIVALLLDQLLGHAIAYAGHPGMTAELTVRYRRPTPFGVPLLLRGRHVATEGRHITATGEIVVDGELTAEATGSFRVPARGWVAEPPGLDRSRPA